MVPIFSTAVVQTSW